MYRLPFKDIGESGDGCIDENGLREGHLGGDIYEGRKGRAGYGKRSVYVLLDCFFPVRVRGYKELMPSA